MFGRCQSAAAAVRAASDGPEPDLESAELSSMRSIRELGARMRQRGEPIPDGWAMDQAGNSTTNAALGIAGNILPMAGHKGYAIATMMDVLSGVLSGSHFGATVVGPY